MNDDQIIELLKHAEHIAAAFPAAVDALRFEIAIPDQIPQINRHFKNQGYDCVTDNDGVKKHRSGCFQSSQNHGIESDAYDSARLLSNEDNFHILERNTHHRNNITIQPQAYSHNRMEFIDGTRSRDTYSRNTDSLFKSCRRVDEDVDNNEHVSENIHVRTFLAFPNGIVHIARHSPDLKHRDVDIVGLRPHRIDKSTQTSNDRVDNAQQTEDITVSVKNIISDHSNRDVYTTKIQSELQNDSNTEFGINRFKLPSIMSIHNHAMDESTLESKTTESIKFMNEEVSQANGHESTITSVASNSPATMTDRYDGIPSHIPCMQPIDHGSCISDVATFQSPSVSIPVNPSLPVASSQVSDNQHAKYNSNIATERKRKYHHVEFATPLTTPNNALRDTCTKHQTYTSSSTPCSSSGSGQRLPSSDTANYSVQDDLLSLHMWPNYIKQRMRVWKFSQPSKLRTTSKLGKIVYWIRDIFRVENNFALETALWQSKHFNLPVIAVMFCEKTMLEDILEIQSIAQIEGEWSRIPLTRQSFLRKSLTRMASMLSMKSHLETLNIPTVLLKLPEKVEGNVVNGQTNQQQSSSSSSANIPAMKYEQAISALQSWIPGGIFSLISDLRIFPTNLKILHDMSRSGIDLFMMNIDCDSLSPSRETDNSPSIPWSSGYSHDIKSYNGPHSDSNKRNLGHLQNETLDLEQRFMSMMQEIKELSRYDRADISCPIRWELQLKVCSFEDVSPTVTSIGSEGKPSLTSNSLRRIKAVKFKESRQVPQSSNDSAEIQWTVYSSIMQEISAILSQQTVDVISNDYLYFKDMVTIVSIRPPVANMYTAVDKLLSDIHHNEQHGCKVSDATTERLKGIINIILSSLYIGSICPLNLLSKILSASNVRGYHEESLSPESSLSFQTFQQLIGNLSYPWDMLIQELLFFRSNCVDLSANGLGTNISESNDSIVKLDWFQSFLPESVRQFLSVLQITSNNLKFLSPAELRSTSTSDDHFNRIHLNLILHGALSMKHDMIYWLAYMIMNSTSPKFAIDLSIKELARFLIDDIFYHELVLFSLMKALTLLTSSIQEIIEPTQSKVSDGHGKHHFQQEHTYAVSKTSMEGILKKYKL